MNRYMKKMETQRIQRALQNSTVPDYKSIRESFIARGMPFGKAYNASIRYYRIFGSLLKTASRSS